MVRGRTIKIVGSNICLGVLDFHSRQGIKPFQAEHFRLKSCSFFFGPTWLSSIATIWKCPNFVPEMSSILDTRIPSYCNSEWPCMCCMLLVSNPGTARLDVIFISLHFALIYFRRQIYNRFDEKVLIKLTLKRKLY